MHLRRSGGADRSAGSGTGTSTGVRRQQRAQHVLAGGGVPGRGVAPAAQEQAVDAGGRELTFLLGSREIVDENETINVVSEQAPLGAAVNGKKIDDSAEYEAPSGKTIAVTVKRIEAYTG